ncbi:MAG TPA: S26 family signal peptidase [Gemmata sp.]|jgi:signal peptidase I|nr:S26 family signal peptidase [Gemmata sp.]
MPDLDEQTATVTQMKKKAEKKPTQHRDPAREVIETIVFVVVLVLLLKLFVTEAFVIPTGSMAETLYGYQKMITCPKCEHEFPVNSHDEVEGNQVTGRKTPLYGFCCPNCRYLGHVEELKPAPSNRTGDRVLVLKPLYHLRDPKRGDVVVFKYPDKPQEKQTAQNYIKRAEGFGGETVAIHHGDLYVTRSLSYPADDPLFPRPSSVLDLWNKEYMYSTVYGSNPRAVDLFELSRVAGFPSGQNGFGSGGFEIVRKGEKQLLADRRIVWDNDKQPKDLATAKVPARWYAPTEGKNAWHGDDSLQPRAFAHDADDLHWIRYRHLAMQWKTSLGDTVDMTPPTDFKELATQSPIPIDNFLGYNAGRDLDPQMNRATPRDNSGLDQRWVGDLILECEVELGNGAEIVMELSKGVNRFQAVFGNGKVSLSQSGRGGESFKNPSRPCKVAAGKYTIRFANVDCRLWVWVDGKCIDFGNEGDYQPVEPIPSDGANAEGWVKANDVDAPASIGAKGQATIRHIVLHRDIYYTRSGGEWYKIDDKSLEKMRSSGVSADAVEKLKTISDKVFLSRDAFTTEITSFLGFAAHNEQVRTIVSIAEIAGADIFYVQPGHYLCLGDNSAQSSDSRKWGLVPERLMLGKAVFVFFPPGRVGFIK